MIVSTKAISYGDMAKLFNISINENEYPILHNIKNLKDFIRQFDNVWIVSIRDPEEPPIFNQKAPNLLSLAFHDITIISDEQKKKNEELGRIIPNETHAQQIVEFVKKAHETNPDAKDLLLAHCMMGISRSGAVITFTSEYCKLDMKELKRLNPMIRPNRTLLKLIDNIIDLQPEHPILRPYFTIKE